METLTINQNEIFLPIDELEEIPTVTEEKIDFSLEELEELEKEFYENENVEYVE